jgi:hypothetical protein
MSRPHQVLVPIVAVLAIVGLGFGIYAVASKPSTGSLQHRVSMLEGELSTANQNITALQASTAQAATAGNVGKLEAAMSMLTLCLPQLQQEVGGLNIQTTTQNGYMTNAYIQSPTIISQNCMKTLYGH